MARVEWDRVNKVALQYIEDHWAEPQPTGTTRSPTADTVWVDVIDDFPDDYLPQFHGLLGDRSDFYEAADGSIHRRWPDADFSEPRIRDAVSMRVIREAADTLHLTDQVVIEAMERNDPVPLDVKSARDATRSRREANIRTAVSSAIQQVIDFVPDYDDLRQRGQDAMMNARRPQPDRPHPPTPR